MLRVLIFKIKTNLIRHKTKPFCFYLTFFKNSTSSMHILYSQKKAHFVRKYVSSSTFCSPILCIKISLSYKTFAVVKVTNIENSTLKIGENFPEKVHWWYSYFNGRRLHNVNVCFLNLNSFFFIVYNVFVLYKD